jgi:hypothetical protein
MEDFKGRKGFIGTNREGIKAKVLNFDRAGTIILE